MHEGIEYLTDDILDWLDVPFNGRDLTIAAHSGIKQYYATASVHASKYGIVPGPDKYGIRKNEDWPKMKYMDMVAFMEFYQNVVEECEEFHIPIQDIKGVNLKYKQYGLCVAGAGLNIYLKSAKTLRKIVKELLPSVEGVANQIRQTENNKDGYELLWRIGLHCVKIFDVTVAPPRPVWPLNNDIFHYVRKVECHRLILRFRSQSLTDLELTQIFLHGCLGTYTTLSNTYLTQLTNVSMIPPYNGAPREEWVLPDKWCINSLATDMYTLMERNRPPTTDILGDMGLDQSGQRINRLTEEIPPSQQQTQHPEQQVFCYDVNNPSSPPPTPSLYIQGFDPIVNRASMESNRSRYTRDGNKPPVPNAQRSASRRQRLIRERRPVYDGTCNACGGWGHLAKHCDRLGVFVHLQRYCSHATQEEIAEAERNWMERNKKWLDVDKDGRKTRPNSRSPSTVAMMYIEDNGGAFSLEDLNDQLDWDYFTPAANDDADIVDVPLISN